MTAVATAIIGSAIIGGYLQSKSAKDARNKANRAGRDAFDRATAAQQESRELSQPFIDIGLGAGNQLQNFLSNPNAGLEEINPVVDFLRKQGFEDIQESAAARGRLGAGGTLKDLTQFNTDLTSTVIPQLQNQRFNQLFNVLGLGQNAAAGQGTQAIQTGINQGNILQGIGQNNANAAIQQGNIYSNLLNTGAQVLGQFGSTPQSQQTANTTAGFDFNSVDTSNLDFNLDDVDLGTNYNQLGGGY